MSSSSHDLTDTLSSSGARLEAVVAVAAVTSHRVDAAPVLADARLGTALVQVCQDGEQKDERGAKSEEESRDRTEVKASYKVEPLTHAALSVWSALHARRADAHEVPDQVLAGHALGVAVVQPLGTLVLVWEETGRRQGGDREETGRRQGGDREETERRQGGDREETGRRQGGDREETGRRQGGDREETGRRQRGDREETGRRQGGDREETRRRQGGDRKETGRRQGGDREETGRRQGGDREETGRRQGGDREETGRDREETGRRQPVSEP